MLVTTYFAFNYNCNEGIQFYVAALRHLNSSLISNVLCVSKLVSE